jgi:hypothetical protein
MKNGMNYLGIIDFKKKEKNFIKREKNMQKEVLQIQNKITDIDTLCIKELKKINIIHGSFVLPKT